jgi:DNA-binding transcriptional ArsR family regulator
VTANRPISSDALDAVFDALSHPARRQIVIVLYARGGVMTAGEIADRFKHAWPTTTRHLRVLEAAGLVTSTRRGRQRDYHLHTIPALRAAEWVQTWAAAPTDAGSSQRAEWLDLPYATMRNAISHNPQPTRTRAKGDRNPRAR